MPRPRRGAAAYHLQQAAEKLVKSLLVPTGEPFRRIHDLDELVTRPLPVCPQFAETLDSLRSLSVWRIAYRYPSLEDEQDPPPTIEEIDRYTTMLTHFAAEVANLIGNDRTEPTTASRRQRPIRRRVRLSAIAAARRNALHSLTTRYRRLAVTIPADRMKAMRNRQCTRGLRELRIANPHPRIASVRQRMARQVADLGQADEADARHWNQAVSEFNTPEIPPEQ